MPKVGEPEMMPDMRGDRVHLADLNVGDRFDMWSKRSGGYFYQPDREVTEKRDNGHLVSTGGLVLHTDAGWAEIRRL